MSIYITPQDELHVELQGIALTCPHCRTLTHLTPVAVPRFEDLSRRKPKQIGIVFRCDACDEPVFLKFPVKGYTALRIELSPNFIEVERARENFPLSYLPEESEELFKEALGCYAAGLLRCVRLHVPAHRAIAVPRARRARQARAVRHAAGNPVARPSSTTTSLRTCAACCSARDTDPWPNIRASMPNAPASCSRSCATCCIRPSCARRACCRR